jgi:hypothetical protein
MLCYLMKWAPPRCGCLRSLKACHSRYLWTHFLGVAECRRVRRIDTLPFKWTIVCSQMHSYFHLGAIAEHDFFVQRQGFEELIRRQPHKQVVGAFDKGRGLCRTQRDQDAIIGFDFTAQKRPSDIDNVVADGGLELAQVPWRETIE